MNGVIALAVVAFAVFLTQELVEVLLAPMLVGTSPLMMFG